jgi:hypothetical protein
MAFITDKEELKSGLIIFRRGDVTHRNFYCRVKMPKDDRYKTIALGTSNPESARELAIEKDAEIRVLLKHDHPVFNRSFRKVAEEYLAVQQRRADTGEISVARVKNLKNVLLGALDRYVGSAQIHLVGQDRWSGYPTWRRENGKGRHRDHISDSTIDFEMGAFNAAMNFAIRKRYVPANQRFEGKPKLKTMRRDEFTLDEYRKLHTAGRSWIGIAHFNGFRAKDSARAVECAAEMPAHDRNAAMATCHHHVGHFHRFGEHQPAMLVDRTAARLAARHQFLEIARLAVEQFDKRVVEHRTLRQCKQGSRRIGHYSRCPEFDLDCTGKIIALLPTC